MVDVAQLAEHRVVVPRVVGSRPTIHPSLRSKELRLASPFFAKTVRRSFSVDGQKKLFEFFEIFLYTK